MTNTSERAQQVRTEDQEPQPVLSIRQTVSLADLPQVQGASLAALWQFMQREAVAAIGPPFVRYHTFGDEETDVEVGVPTSAPAAGDGRIVGGELPGGPAITTWHLGSHATLADAYARLQAWRIGQAREPRGAGWEIYTWIDPAVEPDPQSWPAPDEWRTRLIQPVV